jgi:ubiquitin-protein ligase
MPPNPPQLTNSALADEIEAINSIYGDATLSVISSCETSVHAILDFPEQAFSFTVTFTLDYPNKPPQINGTQSSRSSSKGEGTAAAQILRDVIARVWSPGQVCLFDVIEEAGSLLSRHGEAETTHRPDDEERSADSIETEETDNNNVTAAADPSIPPPNWTLSEPVTEKKSIFIARCTPVSSKDEASSSLSHLLATNKKVSSATHNITAWRIQTTETGITVQDCDDDGETAAGGRLLHLMQLMDVWNVVVVVTRWYGGTKLGPDRFRIINSVARDALVKGGFVKTEEDKAHEKEKGGKKKGKK